MTPLAKFLSALTAGLIILTAILLGNGYYDAGTLTLIASLLAGGGAIAEAARR